MQLVPCLTSSTPPALSPFERAVDKLEIAAAVPSAVQRLLRALDAPDVSWREIESILAVDAGLVARVLRMASTAAFAARPVRDLRFATQALGTDQLRRVAVAAHFAGRGSPFTRKLWSYSLRIAFVADTVARTVRHEGADAFLCGLLHDVGTMAFEQIIGPGYAALGFAPGEDRQSELERAQFAFDHSDLGAMVAQRWNLFSELELVAQLHHDPEVGTALGLPAEVQRVVDLVGLARVLGRPDGDPTRPLRDRLCERLGTSAEAAEACAVAAARQTTDLIQCVAG